MFVIFIYKTDEFMYVIFKCKVNYLICTFVIFTYKCEQFMYARHFQVSTFPLRY